MYQRIGRMGPHPFWLKPVLSAATTGQLLVVDRSVSRADPTVPSISAESASVYELLAMAWDMCRLSLRFAEPVSELAFVRSRTDRLARVGMVSRLIMLSTMAALLLGRALFVWRPMFAIVRAVEMAMFALLFLLERSARFKSLLGPSHLEVYWAVNVALVPLTRITSNEFFLERVMHRLGMAQDSQAEASPQSYGGFVLSMIGITLAAKLLPIRNFLLMPMNVVAVVCFSVGVAEFPWGQSAIMTSVFHTVIFAIYVGVFDFGRRIDERCQRDLFVRVAVEKTLRFTAEHQVEQAAGESRSETRSADPDVHSVSAPSATFTARLFSSMATAGSDLQDHLAHVEALGREEHWLVGVEELQCDVGDDGGLSLLGVGGFGFVIPAYYCGARVALKAMWSKQPGPSMPARRLASIATELRVLRRLRHPNLVSFFGAYVEPATMELVLVLERLEGVDLEKVAMAPADVVGLRMRMKLSHDVASALSYLHSRSPTVVHGDIKGSNVFVETLQASRQSAKLLDFGLSRLLGGGNTQRLGGTRLWKAPEVWARTAPPHHSADVYSFGWLLYMTMAGRPPSAVTTQDSLRALFAAGAAPDPPWDGAAADAPECRELCSGCLHFDAAARPQTAQILRALEELLAREGLRGSGEAARGSISEALDVVRKRIREQRVVGQCTRQQKQWMRL